MVVTKFVVSRRSTGWGDCIVSLISAWHYARRTGRTLVIDWRRSCYLGNPRRNAFPAYFEPVTSIAGVPVIGDDTVGSLAYPKPVHVSFGHRALGGLKRWLAAGGLAPSADHFTTAYELSHAEERALLERAEDVAAPTVVLQCSLVEGLPDVASCQAFLAELRPRRDIQEDIKHFVRTRFTGRPVVAVHIRYGSRAILDAHTNYWLDDDRALATIRDGINRASAALGAASRTFVCTDKRRILEAIRSQIADVIAREKYFQPDSQLELHAWDNSARTRARVGREALIEMFLLARADALVCYPPNSFFSFYARTCAGGPSVQVQEDVFRPQTT